MPSPLRAAAVVAAAALAIAAGDAHAAAPSDWVDLRDEIAGPFPALQTGDGRFPDPIQFGAQPGHRASPMLGYGLIQAGLRSGSDDQVDAGLATVTASIELIDRGIGHGAFDHFAIAGAYNLARTELADHPHFAEHRREWENWLRHAKLRHLPKTDHYANKYLVEAVAVLELRRTGLRSKVRGTALAHIDTSVKLARRLINEGAPRASSQSATRIDHAPAYILSDPSNNSLAYHALSLGFLARAIELMGPAASGSARRTLRGVARATWGLSGPDGDLAYIGRSQGLSWTLSLAAYGAEEATAGAGGTWGPRFQAVADRSLDRLATHYGNGPYGWWITPSHEAAQLPNEALDAYATGPTYAGLTLIAVNWAIDSAERHGRRPGKLAADTASVSELSGAKTAFTTVRRADTWMAVRHSPSYSARDLRYDFGLVALKRPGDKGWDDVIRPRPHTTSGPDSAGPLLRIPGGYALPDSERSSVSRAGKVTLVGGYRDPKKHAWVRKGHKFTFQPTGCGARITLPRAKGDLLSYSIFWRDDVNVEGGRLANDHAVVRATPPPDAVEKTEGGASATDALLTRTILHWKPGRAAVRLSICEAK